MSEFLSDKGGTVLLVEDDAGRRALLEQAFTGSGLCLDLIAAAGSAEALTILESTKPDLVIAARALPELAGAEMIPLVRALRAELPFFIIDACRESAEDPDAAEAAGLLEAMRAGATEYVTFSPLDLAKLPYLALRAIEDARTRGRLRELTESHSTEAIRVAAHRQAAEQRGRDLAAIAHDLRSPLSGLMALLDMIEFESDRSLPPPVRERVLRMRAASEQIASLADQIADLSLVETGRLSLASHPVELEETLLAAGRSLEPKLRARDATLKITVPGGLPRLQGDPLRIRQILTSLVAGLLKLAEGTTLELVAASRGAMIEMTLREDPFRGIPVEALPPGFAAEARSGAEPRSFADDLNGLSLSIARGLVRLHGGTLRLPGDVESGTLAVLTLPAETSEPKHRAERPSELLRPSS
ncbi:MAG TPA: histidine kinase dimerization/phospho-acceptor domain-containing protein [Candidatus Polarisedimenticolia bacterium]|jgi:signal transduction histidine kinase